MDKAQKAEYMREYGKRRKRSAEARRAEYLRRKDAVSERYHAEKWTPQYARKVIAADLSASQASIPQELVDAKHAQLLLLRAVRDRQALELPKALAARYAETGVTTRHLADEFGIDRARVASLLKQAGVTIRVKASCRNGHERNADNSRLSKEGWNRCRTCDQERLRRYVARPERGDHLTDRPAP